MKYIAILHKNEGTAYGVTLPDFPGCFSAADTLDEVQANAQEAVELYAEGEAFTPPVPMTFEQVTSTSFVNRLDILIFVLLMCCHP
ncbi:MAG: type II toxin-antitoxin system HicB family antitoxin [Desulfovibrio sp.]|nr:type II toxin-antitoxin system HicB family antitoxin [Desulfovibrio sp.]